MTESQDKANSIETDELEVIEQRAYEQAGPDDLTTVIIMAVADAEGVEMTTITDPPLYDVVDTSAIEDSFFGDAVEGECRDSTGRVEFEYRGWLVTIRSDGWVQVATPVAPRS